MGLSRRGVAVLVAALGLTFGAEADAEVRFEQGVVLEGVEAPRELGADDALVVRVRLRTTGPTRRPYTIFVHGEPRGGRAGCRLVRQAVPPGGPSTRWRDGEVAVRLDLGEAGRCGEGPVALFVGLYDPESGDRLAVLDGAGDYDRVRAGQVLVRERGARVSSEPVLQQPEAAHPSPPPLEAPASLWLLGLFAAAVALAALLLGKRRFPRLEHGPGLEGRAGKLERAAVLAPLGVLLAGVLACLGFVKDDAYISFRYAHNLVSGEGLVFNPGERVEGFTNFLWTMLVAPFEAAGADLLQVCDVIGPIFSAVVILAVVRASRVLDGRGKGLSHLWAACWLAASSSFALWSVGGLEQSLATLLPFAGALLAWEARREGSDRKVVAAAALLAGGCMMRPEGHVFVFVVGVAYLVLAVRGRTSAARRPLLLFAATSAALLGPYHLFRLLYFGSLVPNTYLVKAVSGVEVWRAGLRLVADLLRFDWTGLVVALATLSLLVARDRAVRAVGVGVGLFFLVYVAKVGTDELMWHRLYLPALPFVAVLAASVLRALADALARTRLGRLAYVLGWAVVAVGCWQSLAFTFEGTRGMRGYAGCSGAFHPDLGKYVTRHSRPGALVAFQDMGSTPYHAPDIRFLDLVGLVDRRIATLLQRDGVHPFVPATRARRGGEHCAAVRDYVFSRRPEWVVLVPYPSQSRWDSTWRAFRVEDQEVALRRAGAYHNSQYDCRLYFDPRFAERYVHVRTWPRSATYYLSTFMRRDLWQREPAEVVLHEPPPRGGPEATFDRDLRLLGGEIESEVVVERHEVFVTTRWELPGERPASTLFFVHLVERGGRGYRLSYDHVPGDWLWPATRWREGQVIEDRVLVQLPPGMPPGDYDVFVGVFDRASGRRWEVTSGEGTDDQRVPLGQVRVRRFRHFLDHLIQPTDPARQRRRI